MSDVKRLKRILPKYIRDIKKSPTEENKVSYYRELIAAIFSKLTPNGLIPFTGRSVRVYGRDGKYSTKEADLLWDNVLIEFEINLLNPKIRESERQLCEYLSGCLNKDRTKNYKILSSDGITFRKYRYEYPEDKDIITPEDITLKLVSRMNLESRTIDRRQINHEELLRIIRSELTPLKLNFVPIERAYELFVKDSDLYDRCMRILKKTKHSDHAIQFDEWLKYQNLVYGSFTKADRTTKRQHEIFLDHTYMATIAKILAYATIYPGNIDTIDKRSIISGKAFKHAKISNFITEDFFSWIDKDDTVWEEMMNLIFAELERFDIRNIDRDILRSIYETIEEPKKRHQLGAVYTPEWLAEMTLDELFKQYRETNKLEIPSILDPACGSGTFLALAIRKIIKEYGPDDSKNLLESILRSVVGFDLHPVAVLFSKTNYLIAIKDLVVQKRREISIPVYMSDTLDFPEPGSTSERIDTAHDSIGIYVYRAGDTDLILPKDVIESDKLDAVIDTIQKCAEDIAGNGSMADAHLNGLRNRLAGYGIVSDYQEIICNTAETLASLIRQKRDTIHSFIFKNIYKPAVVGYFDIIVGNPPWVVYRNITDKKRQERLKKSTKGYKLVPEQKNVQAIDTATLFFARCMDRFLKKNGLIGFVMPGSTLQADQHHMFRIWEQNGKIPVQYILIYDMGRNRKVRNLFTVESCVLFGIKKGGKRNNKIMSYQMKGKPRKNSTLDEIESLIKKKEFDKKQTTMYLHKCPNSSTITTLKNFSCRESIYNDQFFQGATITPQSLWVVNMLEDDMGTPEDYPLLETITSSRAKTRWADIRIKRSVSRKYLFSTVYGCSILPFYCKGPRLIVIPAVAGQTSYKMMDSHDLASVGDGDMAEWLDEAKRYWDERRSASSPKTMLKRLDYNKNLTRQNPRSDTILLYNSAGRSYLVSCLIETSDIKKCTAGFIADSSTYYHYPRTIDEGKYLCAVLNSRYMFECISHVKSSINIHKTPWEFDVPKFDPNNADHKRLIEMYEECHIKLKDKHDITRKKALKIIASEISIIDNLVKKIIMEKSQKPDVVKDSEKRT